MFVFIDASIGAEKSEVVAITTGLTIMFKQQVIHLSA